MWLPSIPRSTRSSPSSTAWSSSSTSTRTGGIVRPHIAGSWYTSDTTSGATGSNYTAVAQDVFAFPVFITSGTTLWSQWAVELMASTVATSIHVAVYDDRRFLGYPQDQVFGVANVNGTPLALTTGAGVKLSTTTVGQPGYLRQPMDPGLYWV